ncbi:FecCD family ABC transporter permease [Lutispora sp.]|uniref:FecCD family ABC transporter permease n=1 Tax=Lutispora sp. TaxID=2828727 RepID=UPI0035630D25
MRDESLPENINDRGIGKYIVIAVLFVSVFFLSIGTGKYPISVRDIIGIVTGGEVEDMVRTVFYTLRLPRTIMVIISGIGLSIAGSIYQIIFKNPLASPDIIGVASGANLGAAIAIIFLTGGTLSVAISAFVGGVGAVFVALGLAKLSREKGVVTFVLAGIVIGSIAQGVIMMMKYLADPEKELATMEFWAMGSFASVTADKVLTMLPLFLIGIIGIILLRWKINVLSLSDEEAKSLGVKVESARWAVIIFSTLIVASIICITGLIAFIGLIAPHIARMIRKTNDFSTTILSGFIGAILLGFADCLARSIAGSEIPISILTTFIGAPYLAYLMSRY